MTTLIRKAIGVLSRMSAAEQDEVARFILDKAERPVTLSEAEQAAVADGHADIEAGRFGPDDEFEAILHRLRTA